MREREGEKGEGKEHQVKRVATREEIGLSSQISTFRNHTT